MIDDEEFPMESVVIYCFSYNDIVVGLKEERGICKQIFIINLRGQLYHFLLTCVICMHM